MATPAPVGWGEELVTRSPLLEQLADLRATAAPVEQFLKLTRQAIAEGEMLIASDIATAGLRLYPGDRALRERLAEALVKSGGIERARAILEQLRDESADNPEVLGFLARLDKDLWEAAPTSDFGKQHLQLSINGYLDGYNRTGEYWHGINAATLMVCAGRREQAAALAAEVQGKCHAALKAANNDGERYWPIATLGEAALVLGDLAAAEDWYSQAAELSKGNIDQIRSTRRNARLLMRYTGGDLSLVARWLPIPRVVVVTGHMIDAPDRATPRFPPALLDHVDRQIRRRLQQGGVLHAFGSAACGADLLFLRAALDLGAKVHIVLPFNREEFARTSVDFAGEPWVTWYRELVSARNPRVSLSQLAVKPSMNAARDFDYANRVLYGLARGKASEFNTDLVAMAVWNGQPGDLGGTSSAVGQWQSAGVKTEVIDLRKLAMTYNIDLPAPAATSESPDEDARDSGTQVAAMLFADAKGFGALADDEMQAWVSQYLGLVARVVKGSAHPPIQVNTWGDGLYMVFRSVRDAGVLALNLCDALEQARQSGELRLPIRLRVALHAGPVYRCHNPVTDRMDFVGTHVTRAARLEPRTPEDHIYATEPFAALASADHVEEFRCDYVGLTELDKKYGVVPAYHVRRPRR